GPDPSPSRKSPARATAWTGPAARSGHDQASEFLRLGEHRIMPGIQLMPACLQRLLSAALMRDGRVDALLAPDHRRFPTLPPETVELHRGLHRGDRMRGYALQGPGFHGLGEGDEHAVGGVLP